MNFGAFGSSFFYVFLLDHVNKPTRSNGTSTVATVLQLFSPGWCHAFSGEPIAGRRSLDLHAHVCQSSAWKEKSAILMGEFSEATTT